MRMHNKSDLWIAPVGEGALILAVGALGWALHQPLVFTSLGPTAYELIEKPNAKSAKAYNIVAGHLLALAAGHFGIWAMHAYAAPKVASAGFVPLSRVWATVIAVTLTTLLTLLLHASQPASLSTTLLVSLGSMQTARDALAIVSAVLVITILGEPLRRLRTRTTSKTP
jgi:hypothetical protein